MPSSLLSKFDKAKVVGRARVRSQAARIYPGLDPTRWYGVLKPGQDEWGCFLALEPPRTSGGPTSSFVAVFLCRYLTPA